MNPGTLNRGEAFPSVTGAETEKIQVQLQKAPSLRECVQRLLTRLLGGLSYRVVITSHSSWFRIVTVVLVALYVARSRTRRHRCEPTRALSRKPACDALCNTARPPSVIIPGDAAFAKEPSEKACEGRRKAAGAGGAVAEHRRRNT